MEDQNLPPDEREGGRGSLLWGGAALALLAGLGIAFIIMLMDKGSTKPPPASRGGLIVEAGKPDEDKLDTTKPLRCFVDGQFVGELTLTQCAKRNGVATDSLDVGLDPSGALAAAGTAGTVLTPLPPQAAQPAPVNPTPTAANIATCWTYGRDGWRDIGDMGRGACVQTLFAGQCERQGGAQYGRWGDQTLRLVTGKVEVSGDNRRFRTLVDQGPGCSLPAVD
ncbi:MAG TPA: hypothetical protein VF138_08055 [Caulobacteraceae bacterium]